MTAVLAAKTFDSLIKRLREKFGAPEPLPLELKDQFVWSFLLWEASLADAERGMKKVQASFIDLNELRVSLVEEIVAVIGPRYPRAEERARRMKSALHSLFLREHAIGFDKLKDMNKRAARQYVEALDSIPHFVSARMALLGLGGHATPLDERMLERLIDEGVFEEGTTLDAATAALERHVKATDAVETHLLLLSLCETAGVKRASKPKPKVTKKTGAKAKKD